MRALLLFAMVGQAVDAPPRTIVVDETGCHAGRTAQYRNDKAERDARVEAARLRASGMPTRIVIVTDGARIDRGIGPPIVQFQC